MVTVDNRGLGWRPDLPSIKDYTVETSEIAEMLSGSELMKSKPKKMPATVDLRHICSPVEDQKDIGSCTANAGVGLVEYFERRASGKHLDASRLFLYKVTRNLMHETGDTGAYLRTTMEAMVLFGIPPTEYWPYDTSKYDVEPSSFCYSFARNYRTIKYYRLDPSGTDEDTLLKRIKSFVARGYPAMFGFTVFDSIREASGDGCIPFPGQGERVRGGHAIVAVGYDDKKKIKKETGALLIRNSWGPGWGDGGYGWLPYAYVESGMASDFWTVLKQEWMDSGQFD